MLNIKNIIVPTDFSKLSFSALEYAKDLAEKVEATIHLVHVMDKALPFIASRSTELSEEKILKLIETEACQQLFNAALKLKEDSSVDVIEILRKGTDFEEIVNYAKEVNGDLIVIATHGRTGILHTLLGSVAEKVIRFAKCPVLVITPQEDE